MINAAILNHAQLLSISYKSLYFCCLVPPEKVFVQLFFTQIKASENALILMMVVVQTGQLIFYDTLVQDPVGGFYTISEMKFTQFQNFPPNVFSSSKNMFNQLNRMASLRCSLRYSKEERNVQAETWHIPTRSTSVEEWYSPIDQCNMTTRIWRCKGQQKSNGWRGLGSLQQKTSSPSSDLIKHDWNNGEKWNNKRYFPITNPKTSSWIQIES